MRLPRAAALLLLACLLLAAAPQPAQALRLFGYNMNLGLASNSAAAAAPQQAASTAGPIKPVAGAAASPVEPVAAAAATVAVASAAKPAAAEIEVVQTHQAASMLSLMTATAGLRPVAETPQTAAAKKAAAAQHKAAVSAPASHNTTAAGAAAKKPAAAVQAKLDEPTEVLAKLESVSPHKYVGAGKKHPKKHTAKDKKSGKHSSKGGHGKDDVEEQPKESPYYKVPSPPPKSEKPEPEDDYFNGKSDKKVTKDHSKKEYLEPEDPVSYPKKSGKDSKKSDGWKDEDWGEDSKGKKGKGKDAADDDDDDDDDWDLFEKPEKKSSWEDATSDYPKGTPMPDEGRHKKVDYQGPEYKSPPDYNSPEYKTPAAHPVPEYKTPEYKAPEYKGKGYDGYAEDYYQKYPTKPIGLSPPPQDPYPKPAPYAPYAPEYPKQYAKEGPYAPAYKAPETYPGYKAPETYPGYKAPEAHPGYKAPNSQYNYNAPEYKDSYKAPDSYKSPDSYKAPDSYKSPDSYKAPDSYKSPDSYKKDEYAPPAYGKDTTYPTLPPAYGTTTPPSYKKSEDYSKYDYKAPESEDSYYEESEEQYEEEEEGEEEEEYEYNRSGGSPTKRNSPKFFDDFTRQGSGSTWAPPPHLKRGADQLFAPHTEAKETKSVVAPKETKAVVAPKETKSVVAPKEGSKDAKQALAPELKQTKTVNDLWTNELKKMMSEKLGSSQQGTQQANKAVTAPVQQPTNEAPAQQQVQYAEVNKSGGKKKKKSKKSKQVTEDPLDYIVGKEKDDSSNSEYVREDDYIKEVDYYKPTKEITTDYQKPKTEDSPYTKGTDKEYKENKDSKYNDDDSAYASKPKKGNNKDSSYDKAMEDEGEYVSSKPKKDNAYKKPSGDEEVADDYNTSKSYKKTTDKNKKKDNSYKEQEQYEYTEEEVEEEYPAVPKPKKGKKDSSYKEEEQYEYTEEEVDEEYTAVTPKPKKGKKDSSYKKPSDDYSKPPTGEYTSPDSSYTMPAPKKDYYKLADSPTSYNKPKKGNKPAYGVEDEEEAEEEEEDEETGSDNYSQYTKPKAPSKYKEPKWQQDNSQYKKEEDYSKQGDSSYKPKKDAYKKPDEYKQDYAKEGDKKDYEYKKDAPAPVYPTPPSPPKQYGSYGTPQPVCKSLVDKTQETEIVLDPEEDQATITSLEGSCSDYHPGWDTLGGGCDVVCDDTRDLLKLNMFATKSIATPGYRPSGGAYPVQCSYRADAPLRGKCRVVMTLGCCADSGGMAAPAPQYPQLPKLDEYPSQEDASYGSSKKDPYTKKPSYPEEDASYGKRDAAYGGKKPSYGEEQPKQRYEEQPTTKPGYPEAPDSGSGTPGYKLPKWKREEPQEYKKYDFKGRDQRLLDAYKELQQSLYGPGGADSKRRQDYEPGAGYMKPGYGHQYDEEARPQLPRIKKDTQADYGSSNLKKGGLVLPPLLDELDTGSKDRSYHKQQQQPYGVSSEKRGYEHSSEELLNKYKKEYESLSKPRYPSGGPAYEQDRDREEEKYSQHRMHEQYTLEHEYHHHEAPTDKKADQRPKMDFLDSVLKKDGLKPDLPQYPPQGTQYPPQSEYPAPKYTDNFKEYHSRYNTGDSGSYPGGSYPQQPVVRYDPDEYADEDGPEPEQPKKHYDYLDQINNDRQAAKERLAQRIRENQGAARSPHVRGPTYQQQKTQQAKAAPNTPLPVSAPVPNTNKAAAEVPPKVQKPLQLPNKVVSAPIASGLAGKKITELPIFDAYRVKSDAERWQDRALRQMVRKEGDASGSGSQELKLEFDEEADEEPQASSSQPQQAPETPKPVAEQPKAEQPKPAAEQPKAEPVQAAKKEEAKPPVAAAQPQKQEQVPAAKKEEAKPVAEQPKAERPKEEPVPAEKKEEAKPVAAQPKPQEQKPAAQPAPQKEAEKKPAAAADAAPKVPAAPEQKLDAKVTLPVLAKVAEQKQQPAAAPVAAAVQAVPQQVAKPTEAKPAAAAAVASTAAASKSATVQAATASTKVAAATAAAAPASQPAVAATASQQQAAKAA